MKNFTVGITLFLCIFIQSCTEEPNGLQSKKELSKNELKTVLESSEQFNNLIALRVAFHQEIANNFNTLSEDQVAEFESIIDQAGSVDILVRTASQEVRGKFALLSRETAPIVADEYNKLVESLSLRFAFSENDLSEIIVDSVSNAAIPSEASGRTAAMSCQTTCANKAEAYYWDVYRATGNSDLAAFGAESFYAGCLTGCGS